MSTYYGLVLGLFGFIFLVPFQSCSQMSNTKILSLLNKRYGKEFSILQSQYSPETGKIHAEAVCSEFPDLPFIVEYNNNNDLFQSYFEEVLWTDEAKKWVGAELKKYYSKYASNTKVRVNKHVDLMDIPSLASIRRSNADSVSLNIQVYLFKDLNESNADELLRGIVAIANQCIEEGLEQLSCTVSFYDEQYFTDKKLDDYNFGFTSVAPSDFEKMEEEKFRQKIMFRVFSNSSPVSTKNLYDIRTDNPFQLMFHLFK